jgi:hypothetical protein
MMSSSESPNAAIIATITEIMTLLPAWEEEYTRMPEGCLRTISSPNYGQFHRSHPKLGELVEIWSRNLPSLSFKQQVEAVAELNKILLPGTGRDLYCIDYILENINPDVIKIFIKALVGAIFAGSVSDCVITDCSSNNNPEGLYKMTHRSNFKTFSKYGLLTSLIPFIRMIRSYDKYIETAKTDEREWYIKMSTERIAEIDLLKSCTDFSKLYDKPIFVNDGTTISYVGHPEDYFKSHPIPLTEKIFNWINNPKEIFETTMWLEADWTVTYAGDYDRLYSVLSSLESRF